MAKKKPGKSQQGQSKDDESIDFEDALDEVQSIVEELEAGELGLSDALERYEKGVKRLKQCHEELDAAEQRVRVLSGLDESGYPITKPLADGRQGTRKRKQSESAKPTAGGGDSVSDQIDETPGLF